jgi:hypothetical protein
MATKNNGLPPGWTTNPTTGAYMGPVQFDPNQNISPDTHGQDYYNQWLTTMDQVMGIAPPSQQQGGGSQPPAGGQPPPPAQNPTTPPVTPPTTPQAPLGPNNPNLVTAQPGPQMNPQQLLDDFLASDPRMIYNHVINTFRGQGGSYEFLTFLDRNFNRYYNQYLGELAQAALSGSLPTGSFVEFMGSSNVQRDFFGESAAQRGTGSGTNRYTQSLAQGV